MLLSQMASLAEGEEFLLGAFLGAMTLMALYHLALYVAIRERGFLYYAMYLLAFASSKKRYSLPERRAESPVQVSLSPSTAKLTLAAWSTCARALAVFWARGS